MTKQALLEYIRTNQLMALATHGENPWICWVFFLIDDDLNVYFISPDSQHTQHIAQNPHVACAMTDTTQPPAGTKKGVQMHGVAEQVTGIKQLKWFFKMWKEILVRDEKKLTYDNYHNKVLSSHVYKITPQKIKWFNQEFDDGAFILDL